MPVNFNTSNPNVNAYPTGTDNRATTPSSSNGGGNPTTSISTPGTSSSTSILKSKNNPRANIQRHINVAHERSMDEKAAEIEATITKINGLRGSGKKDRHDAIHEMTDALIRSGMPADDLAKRITAMPILATAIAEVIETLGDRVNLFPKRQMDVLTLFAKSIEHAESTEQLKEGVNALVRIVGTEHPDSRARQYGLEVLAMAQQYADEALARNICDALEGTGVSPIKKEAPAPASDSAPGPAQEEKTGTVTGRQLPDAFPSPDPADTALGVAQPTRNIDMARERAMYEKTHKSAALPTGGMPRPLNSNPASRVESRPGTTGQLTQNSIGDRKKIAEEIEKHQKAMREQGKREALQRQTTQRETAKGITDKIKALKQNGANTGRSMEAIVENITAIITEITTLKENGLVTQVDALNATTEALIDGGVPTDVMARHVATNPLLARAMCEVITTVADRVGMSEARQTSVLTLFAKSIDNIESAKQMGDSVNAVLRLVFDSKNLKGGAREYAMDILSTVYQYADEPLKKEFANAIVWSENFPVLATKALKALAPAFNATVNEMKPVQPYRAWNPIPENREDNIYERLDKMAEYIDLNVGKSERAGVLSAYVDGLTTLGQIDNLRIPAEKKRFDVLLKLLRLEYEPANEEERRAVLKLKLAFLNDAGRLLVGLANHEHRKHVLPVLKSLIEESDKLARSVPPLYVAQELHNLYASDLRMVREHLVNQEINGYFPQKTINQYRTELNMAVSLVKDLENIVATRAGSQSSVPEA